MFQEEYNFIVSDITESALELFCNCYYFGFESVEYYPDYDESQKVTVIIPKNRPFVTLKDLETGNYIIRGVSKNGTKTVKHSISFSRFKNNIDFIKGMIGNVDGFENVFKNLQGIGYLRQLYDTYSTMEIGDKKEEFKQKLTQIAAGYNKVLNVFSNKEVKSFFVNQVNAIRVCTLDENTDCYWYFSEYNYNKWIGLEKEYTKPNCPIRLDDEKLYRITIMKNDSPVKFLYIFSFSEKEYAKKFNKTMREKIEIEKNRYNDIVGFNEDRNKEKLLSMFNIEPKLETILTPPNIEYDKEDDKIILNNTAIKDFIDIHPKTNIVVIEDKNDFDDIYLDNIELFKKAVALENEKIDLSNVSILDGGNYYVYYADDVNNILSTPVYFNRSETYDEINRSYDDFVIDRYERALFKTFSLDYRRANEWYVCKELLNKYQVLNIRDIQDISDFLIQGIIENKKRISSIDKLIYCVLKCSYDFFSDRDGNLGNNQTFKRRYGTHMVPRKDNIVKITRLSDSEITKEYYDISKESLEAKIDNDGDYVILQNIDKKTKRVSEPIMYNNSGHGLRYYFGRTQVTIDDKK